MDIPNDEKSSTPRAEIQFQGEKPVKLSNTSKLLLVIMGLLVLIVLSFGIYFFAVKKTQRLPQKQSEVIVSPSSVTTFPTVTSIKPAVFVFAGASMFPNYKDKQVWMYDTNVPVQLKRDEVVVFHGPIYEKLMAKRIIGLAGDTILVKDGDVYLDGRKLDESGYLHDANITYGGAFLREDISVTIPQDSYFIMGDNRPYSSDSREWGFLPKKDIIGILTTQIEPLNKAQDGCSCWDTDNNICLPQIACK